MQVYIKAEANVLRLIRTSFSLPAPFYDLPSILVSLGLQSQISRAAR